MKQLSNIIIVITVLFAIGSCTKENMDPLGEWTLTDPEITSPSTDAVILEESTPAASISFEWKEAVSSARYQIRYSVVIDTVGSESFKSPILKIDSDNSGKGNTATVLYDQLDEALAIAGYPAGQEASLTWAVIANCVGTISTDSEAINITRFNSKRIPNTLYLSGTATENGDDLSVAMEMKKMIDTVNVFEIFTHLEAEGDFKFYSQQSLPAYEYGADGDMIEVKAAALQVQESGEYHVSVNLSDFTYTLTKIDRMAIIGSPLADGWNSDEALEYQGAGVWQAQINFVGTGGFAFRANSSWDFILKQITGTDNQLIIESFANQYSESYQDIETAASGESTVILNLSADGYTYTIESSGPVVVPITTPDALFLLDGEGNTVCELVKDGDVFTSDIYLALQQSVTYSLNSSADGTGTSYTIDANLGAAEVVTADKVMESTIIREADGDISVDHDQAYHLTVDASTGEFKWHFYNLKVFHWLDWADRIEQPMTYSHPYTFTATMDMYADWETKFNSPWEVEFGALQGTSDDVNATVGTATNKGLQEDPDLPNENFLFITADGSYTAEIIVENDYKTANYTVSSN